LQLIKHNGALLAILGDAKDMPRGKYFWDDKDSPLQWGTQYLNKGDTITPHIHKIRDRNFKSKSIEVFVMLLGKLRANIFSNDKIKVYSFIMRGGQFLVTYDGGHGFETVTDKTKFIEIKLGQFTNIEDDKEKF